MAFETEWSAFFFFLTQFPSKSVIWIDRSLLFSASIVAASRPKVFTVVLYRAIRTSLKKAFKYASAVVGSSLLLIIRFSKCRKADVKSVPVCVFRSFLRSVCPQTVFDMGNHNIVPLKNPRTCSVTLWDWKLLKHFELSLCLPSSTQMIFGSESFLRMIIKPIRTRTYFKNFCILPSCSVSRFTATIWKQFLVRSVLLLSFLIYISSFCALHSVLWMSCILEPKKRSVDDSTLAVRPFLHFALVYDVLLNCLTQKNQKYLMYVLHRFYFSHRSQ